MSGDYAMQTSTRRTAARGWNNQAEVRPSPSSPTGRPQERIFEVVYTVTNSPCVDAALSTLREEDGIEVARFTSAQHFLEHVRADTSSCLILDLPQSDCEEMGLRCQLATKASPPVIFVCDHSEIGSAVRAMKAGAVELLTVPVDPSALLEAVQLAIVQDRKLRQRRAERERLNERFELLTPREREVFPLIVRGLLNKQAAAVLDISEVTLQIHRSQVMRKMQAGSVADLVRMAARLHIPLWSDKRAEAKAPLELLALPQGGPRAAAPRVS
jgi:FixJ family two-component response regulator